MKNTIKLIREKRPLIHHITNWVTIYDCAQVTRAVGALPVMAHAKEEVGEMTGIASALVINIGTLTNYLIDSMILAGKKANGKKIPVILDIVGCGATKMRNEKTVKIIKNIHVDIIKGNAGEIASLAGAEAEVRGVESIGVKGDIKEIAKNLAHQEKCTVIITGKKDLITDGTKIEECLAGHEKMGEVVGTGCMAASVIGCFSAVAKVVADKAADADYVESSLKALTYYGNAGEAAAKKSSGPFDFKIKMMDQLAL